MKKDCSKYLLALNKHPMIGSQRLKKILAGFQDLDKLWLAQKTEIGDRLKDQKLVNYVIEAIEKYNPDIAINELISYDIGYITILDQNYPKLLKEIHDCPAVLYLKGNHELLNKLSIGVVGSRKYTNYGSNNAYKFSSELAKQGIVVTSGMALGIDAFAHRAAVDNHGFTIGVLGCGLDQIYPVSNYQLGKDIINNAGLLISEFPPKTPPLKQNFPARNRIIAGLSKGVLVVEAALKSGALITAYQALEYNREVFAIPGNIDSENSAGTNSLIKQGAKMVCDVSDIISEFNMVLKTEAVEKNNYAPKNEDEKIILEVLKNKQYSANELVIETGLSIVAVSCAITLLEMNNVIISAGGGRYKVVA